MTDMTSAIETYLENIKSDYEGFNCADNEIRERMIAEFNEGLGYNVGKKYIKVTTRNSGSVHSFIVNTHNDGKFQYGDILKAASWATPARNFSRGNVFSEYDVKWTGA